MFHVTLVHRVLDLHDLHEGKGAASLDSSVEAQEKTNAKKPHRVLESLDAAFMYKMGDGGFEPPTPTMST